MGADRHRHSLLTPYSYVWQGESCTTSVRLASTSQRSRLRRPASQARGYAVALEGLLRHADDRG